MQVRLIDQHADLYLLPRSSMARGIRINLLALRIQLQQAPAASNAPSFSLNACDPLSSKTSILWLQHWG